MQQTCKLLPGSFYRGSTVDVARGLLGQLLVRRDSQGRRLSGIVVEVEAYLSADDPASHSHRGVGKKNASMFLAPGRLYVYPIHSRHCLNLVTENKGSGAAVLIRALEPVEGVDHMAQHRGLPAWDTAGFPVRPRRLAWAKLLTSGPGRLCQALDVDRRVDGIDVRKPEQVWFEEATMTPARKWQAIQAPRIGLSQARELPLRWFLDGHHFVSGRSIDHSQGRTWSFLEW